LTLGGTYVRLGDISETAVIARGFLLRSGGVAPYIKRQTTLTYRGDKTRAIYQTHKIFPEYQKMAKWIHSGGYSRPDKRTVKKGGKKK
jgi:hypothetical protein